MRDCAIVCGYPVNEDGSISDILKSRIDKGIELYEKKQVSYLILSGGCVHNQYSESLCMKDYAMKKGISDEVLLIENKAKSTYHNMMYSKEMMDRYHLIDCYIVTNHFHMRKAQYYAKKFHLNYEKVMANRADNMSWIKEELLTLYMPINMFLNRLKGYK